MEAIIYKIFQLHASALPQSINAIVSEAANGQIQINCSALARKLKLDRLPGAK